MPEDLYGNSSRGHKTSTIYQTRIALYNMLECARKNDVIITNPCKKSGKNSKKTMAIPLTDEVIRILKAEKEKNRKIKIVPMEWAAQVFLCRKREPVKNSTYDKSLFKICDKVGIKRFSKRERQKA